ncbi:AMP-binding protein [Pseudothauera rhizosphaerae]|uniref:Long-chain fatty acid--CoA ligase n=1 Tax=Pseudothauera rhizosphaerae TaxID=2565932 RepID=A0A4S4AN93_9RHOO|nr:AMP-binding protein [Pseudothauera rhizosphaerae]THF61028.1 long-chain fatty acid--CoA ligase [Pseudothauera rhizosphaerae]
MGEFDWRDELARHPCHRVLLAAPGRAWWAGEIVAELDALCERLAASRVLAVLADNGPEWVMADLAAQSAGVVHLPLPAFFTSAQLSHALERSGADTVLTDQPERIGALDLGFCLTGRRQGLHWMRRVAAPAALPAGTAKISFTSGSTGAPKGVCLSAQGLLDTARAVDERLRGLPLERHLAVLPLALLLENVAGVYAPLLRGMAVHLPPLASLGWRGAAGFDPAGLDRSLRKTRASSVILVPELLKAWLGLLQHSGRLAPGSLCFAAVGGARVASGLLTTARRAGLPVCQGYGLTEAGSVVCLNLPGEANDGDDVGRPLAHARVEIDDGEVVVRSRGFLGYAGNPVGEGGVFRTGDLGVLDVRGHLRLAGRRKNLLITSFGRNVAPEWIESLLLADARVLQALVTGDGRPSPVALLVPAPGVEARQLGALVAGVNAGLPDYARIARWRAVPPFTAADGTATGNGRPVRSRINQLYAGEIAALYDNEEPQDELL